MLRSHFHYGKVLVGLGMTTLAAAPAWAGDLVVPQQYPNIQAAINAAAPGDVVVVAPGVYSGPGNRDLNLLGKAITLKSASGAASCVIDAHEPNSQAHCGIMLQSNESSATVIDGFTITGGTMFNGGGIYIQNGSPTIRNCVMTGNLVGCWGGGVYCEGGSSPRFFNCSISGNISSDEGGGVFCNYSNAYFESCIIAGNSGIMGGGVCAFGGQNTFVNCRITGNTATYTGGGLYLWMGKLVNCTVANNSASYQGSGAYVGASAVITNSIVWGNTGSSQMNSQPSVVTYSIVQNGMPGVGNSSIDPGFMNAAAGDYRLIGSSPAVDAGSNQAVPAGVVTDLAGAARIAQPSAGKRGRVDMGAYELQPADSVVR